MTDLKYPELLDVEQTMDHLRAIVAQFGENYVYIKRQGSDVCAYVHSEDDELVPGCIVAQVLYRHGVPMGVLSMYEGLGAVQLSDAGSLTLRDLKPLLTPAAGQVLGQAQWRQDMLHPWGDALAEAESVYARMKSAALDAAEAKYRKITEEEGRR